MKSTKVDLGWLKKKYNGTIIEIVGDMVVVEKDDKPHLEYSYDLIDNPKNFAKKELDKATGQLIMKALMESCKEK